MSVAVEAPMPSMPLPLPAHFSHAEQSFSLKKRRPHFSSSSSSCSSPPRPSNSLPPLPPSKGCPSVSRLFPQPQSPWTPLSASLTKSPPPNSVYNPNKQQSYFSQCFTNLGLLGRGSFGEVYKVQSTKDGHQYAVKRSAQRFRGNLERNRSVREARNHERLCPHPHILDFVAAWEESDRLFIQTELCSTSLLLHAENQPPGPDEPSAWAYLCDLLAALQHLHSHGFVHLDLKPANVLITRSGRLKLGDFGLLYEVKQTGAGANEKEDAQEGDPRYMAPELLRGEYGPAADVFSLGVSILELACNIEVPNGGEGWQQLRQGCLPLEFTSGLSAELQTVLRMMLAPEPSTRATVSELLALPSVRKRRWKRRLYLMVVETVLTLASLCQSVVSFGSRLLSPFHFSFPWWNKPAPCTPPKDSWDRDLNVSLSVIQTDSESPECDGVFHSTHTTRSPMFSHRVRSRLSMGNSSTPVHGSPLSGHRSPARSPSHSDVSSWSSLKLARTPSSIHSNGSCCTLTPGGSPLLTQLQTGPSPARTLQRGRRRRLQTDEAEPRPGFEPKNLLSLFEETSSEGQS
ncbi:membrane-associated tyrosine- and threonine-specific cdc2-inhibitory kinase [Salarias fasciatus]|uniref:membrane-associated tyrosine- and threonine-specific cdc2-inhibitory kinase n=1 Tax=Salarias fasciatus TaxID=181472 RepID=UPI001176DB13|nr:membrane-associated tyrosine- and threonine-specific cdc2-inhibitory kinase [Salarias fasciatus]